LQKEKDRIFFVMLNKRKFYINGQWVDPIKPKDCNVINPSTEENCAVIQSEVKLI
jgi:hypothetical protein